MSGDRARQGSVHTAHNATTYRDILSLLYASLVSFVGELPPPAGRCATATATLSEMQTTVSSRGKNAFYTFYRKYRDIDLK